MTRDSQQQRPIDGVVAVVSRNQQLLLIRRAATVIAPRAYCFPGGGVEQGESEQDALQREFLEELGTPIIPIRRLWQCVTPWNVSLAWWKAELTVGGRFMPDPNEVEDYFWLSTAEIARLPQLLESNRQFLTAWHNGEFEWE